MCGIPEKMLGLFGGTEVLRDLDPQAGRGTVEVAGIDRTFHIHIPSSYYLDKNRLYPIFFVFHGGGSKPTEIKHQTKFHVLGEQENFIVVYPFGDLQ